MAVTGDDDLPPGTVIDRVRGDEPGIVEGLSALLADAVADGASVGFLSPLPADAADAYWQGVFAARRPPLLLVARRGDDITGTVHVAPCANPNGRHRGELNKLLVHRDHRRQGLASALLARAEHAAGAAGISLLVLDTLLGTDSERLYQRLGWQRVGSIPGYAGTPDGVLQTTVYYYKTLRG